MKALIIGGSGSLSGVLAAMAKEKYEEVYAVTRGNRPLPEGIRSLVADRNDKRKLEQALLSIDTKWDVIFDCICMNENHAKQDLEVLSQVSNRLIVISTDSVYDPKRKHTPQAESGFFVEENGSPEQLSYAGNKRRMEQVFLHYFDTADADSMKVTLFRPGHIYGPGFLLGCYPEHSRQKELPELILSDTPLSLVASGIYLIHPIFVNDLAKVMLDCVEKPNTYQQIFCVGGPDAVENHIYYKMIGDILGKEIKINEIPLTGYLEAHPEFSGHLCHRIYDLSKLKNSGVMLPDTPLYEGLALQLKSMGYIT